jgi:hypothetical protein
MIHKVCVGNNLIMGGVAGSLHYDTIPHLVLHAHPPNPNTIFYITNILLHKHVINLSFHVFQCLSLSLSLYKNGQPLPSIISYVESNLT